jgi:arylsulfatase A-like enzyme
VWASACGGPAGPRPDGLPPNLLVVVLDTLRPDHLGLYGNPRPTSPNLDALARECVVFENAQSVAPWTAPSLISLVTSLRPDVHRVVGFPNPGRLDEKVTTLAEVLSAAGYETAAFTEGGYAKAEFGLGQGFDTFPENAGDREGNGSNMIHPSRIEQNLDRAVDWLEDHRDRPFFMLFHTYEVHEPYLAPPAGAERIRPGWDPDAEHPAVADAVRHWNRDRTLSDEEFELILRHAYHCQLRDAPRVEDSQAMLASGLVPGREAEWLAAHPDFSAWLRDLYDAELAWTDEALGRLWKALDALDLRRDTVIVLVSDHGEALGDHGEVTHGMNLHEELLHVLLAICGVGPDRGPRRVPDVVASIDVMPTVLELLGVEDDAGVRQGRSLVPLMRGEHLPPAPAVGTALSTAEPGRMHSLRTGRWRLTLDAKTGRATLYDHDRGPEEALNAAGGRPDVVRELRARLAALIEADRALGERLALDAGGAELDAGTRRELEALGYVDGEE